jgi:hypothetical protein
MHRSNPETFSDPMLLACLPAIVVTMRLCLVLRQTQQRNRSRNR